MGRCGSISARNFFSGKRCWSLEVDRPSAKIPLAYQKSVGALPSAFFVLSLHFGMKFEAMEVIFLGASMNEAVFGRKVARSVGQGLFTEF